jgi:hypothetical protein
MKLVILCAKEMQAEYTGFLIFAEVWSATLIQHANNVTGFCEKRL